MTDNWIIQDIERNIKQSKRVVILDPSGQCAFLLPFIKQQGYLLLSTNAKLTEEWQIVKEELFLRCEAERKFKSKKIDLRFRTKRFIGSKMMQMLPCEQGHK